MSVPLLQSPPCFSAPNEQKSKEYLQVEGLLVALPGRHAKTSAARLSTGAAPTPGAERLSFQRSKVFWCLGEPVLERADK
jgi:hypothetical protein